MSLPSLLGSSSAGSLKGDARIAAEAAEALVAAEEDVVTSGGVERSCGLAWRAILRCRVHAVALTYDGVGPETRFIFKDLETQSEAFSRYLLQHRRVVEGDIVVTISENRPELVTLMLTCLKIGAVFVPLASDLRMEHCRDVVDLYDPKVIFCDQPKYVPLVRPTGLPYDTIELPSFHSDPNFLDNLLLRTGDDAIELVTVVDVSDNPCMIFSTSGSTGLPKGVVYTSRMVTMAIYTMTQTEPSPYVSAAKGKSLVWQPMRGLGSLLVLRNLLAGGQTVLVDVYPCHPMHWANLVDKHSVKSIYLFGAAMHQLLQEMPGRIFSSVTSIFYGGSCFSASFVQQSMEQFPAASFWQGYGMTEVGLISSLKPEDHKRAGVATSDDMLRMTSAGKPHTSVEVLIEDPDQPGSGLPPATGKDGVGQICVASPLLMLGYYKCREKTHEAIPDGRFLRTGDLGKFDNCGYLFIVGRVKDVIPSHQGFNIAPRDIEDVLYTLESVGQAAVVGMLHPSGAGEMVVAWAVAKVEASLASHELREHCEVAGLPLWQMPDVFVVSQRPLPTTGDKTAANVLRGLPFVSGALFDLWYAGGHAVDSLPLAARELFRDLDIHARSNLGLDELRPILDDSAAAFLELSVAGSIAHLRLDDWLATLSRMSSEDIGYWVLLARSLLACRRAADFSSHLGEVDSRGIAR
eukprot:TRINITY_DN35114_c0_g1_i1.p1 TRINITY_DN35114_c0_g1~~TRINITY_DN35114_c0_g1_i1.p1  ORF type:complete len:690 (-),score=76.03 TRINITY_DN35114_c0_g1_i1:617-2686(-)